jgi:D-glycero-D-manno-heptose 1,7-bisphosphate phosphatase
MDTRPVSYVFLDRDGVLNRKMPEGEYVRAWAQFEWLAGAEEAVARLNRAGATTIVVSNQRGIALGLYTLADVEVIHSNMQGDLARKGAWLDAIYYCPHDEGECSCRKPDIGLFEQACEKFPEANPGNSVLMGDSLSDIQAGRRVGMRTVFIQGDPSRQKAGANEGAELADAVADNLLEAVETYLKFG